MQKVMHVCDCIKLGQQVDRKQVNRKKRVETLMCKLALWKLLTSRHTIFSGMFCLVVYSFSTIPQFAILAALGFQTSPSYG